MPNFDEALRDINKPDSAYYVPDVDPASMSFAQMYKYYSSLADQLKNWQQKFTSGTAKEDVNIKGIMNVQTDKLDAYRDKLDNYAKSVESDTPVIDFYTGKSVTESAFDKASAGTRQADNSISESALLNYKWFVIGAGIGLLLIFIEYMLVKNKYSHDS